MKQLLYFLFLCFWFVGCNNITSKKKSTGIINLNKTIEESHEYEEEMVPVEEQVEELNDYQKARLEHSKKELLPLDVVLKNAADIHDFTILNFERILKVSTNWFLCKYATYEGELENVYYVTFDYNGNQLDAKMVLGISEASHGSIDFNTDSTFIVTRILDEGVLDENDHFVIVSSREELTNYTITNDGKINKTEE